MATCYICGKNIPSPTRRKRRLVRIGLQPRGKGWRSTMAMRVVCSSCDSFLVRQERTRIFQLQITTGLLIAIAFILLLAVT